MNFKTGKNQITFNSNGDKIVGWLYMPKNYELSKKYNAITIAGPLGTVKEQAASLFADKLSKEGFITLAFDFATQGESEGSPKNYDNPFRKGEDIQNAISFLHTLENTKNVGALGVCAGASYTMHGIVSDSRVKAFASVVGYFSLREFVGYNPLVTEDIRTMLLNQSSEARQKYFETGVSEGMNILYPESAIDLPMTGLDVNDVEDYYYTRVDTCWPNFSRKMSAMSYEAHIKSHALDLGKDLSIPYLGITGTNAISKPYTERFMNEILHDKKEMIVLEDARHVQCYDSENQVNQVVDSLAKFYRQNL